MTHNPHSIRKPTASRPARSGFATLLYSYFIVSFLLMYTMTLMARSSTELHNAERTADLQQAFWAAEGELEASIANMRLSVPPTLGDAKVTVNSSTCQDDYSSHTLTTDGVSSRSRLCGTSATNNYILEATGTSGSISHVVSAVITYQADTLTFTQAALAQNVSLSDYTTGFVEDAVKDPTSFSPTKADVSTTEAKPLYYFDGASDEDGCEPQTRPWVSSEDSKIGGRIQVGPGGDPWDAKMVEVVGHPPQGRKDLESLPRLPDVEVPSQAVDLGSLNVGTVGSTQSSGAGRMCLASGTYKATSVSLSTDSELCTVGPVSLYVTGGDDTSVWLAPGARVYGQPKTTTKGTGAEAKTVNVQPYDGVYGPQNLRLFVKEGTVWLGQDHSLAVAVVYAPRSTVIAPTNGTLLGSIMASEVSYGPPVPWSGAFNSGLPTNSLVYDQALENTKIPVGPVDVKVRMWGEGVTAEQQLAQFINGTPVTSRTTADLDPGKWPGSRAQAAHDRALQGLAAVQPGVDACHAANSAADEVTSARDAADSASAAAQEAEEAHNAKKAAKEAEKAAQAAENASAAAASAHAYAQAAADAAAKAKYPDVILRASSKAASASSAASEATQAAQAAAASAAAAQAAADAAAAEEAAAKAKKDAEEKAKKKETDQGGGA